MKNKKVENMENQEIGEVSIERYGRSIRNDLTEQFKMWKNGLSFRDCVSKRSYQAKALGMTIDEFSTQLQMLGFIKICRTPTGARFVFAGDCPMTDDEMREWLQEQEIIKQARKA